MWIHLLESVFSWLAILLSPLLWMAPLVGAEVLLDRTLHFFQPRK
jgi:hypothetical protein